jgi:hypothetical protein
VVFSLGVYAYDISSNPVDPNETPPETSMSHERITNNTVELENPDGESVTVEIEPITKQKVLETLKQDLELLEFQGMWWVGGEIDSDGKLNIIGGSGIDNLSEYVNSFKEGLVETEHGAYLSTATQTIAGFVNGTNNPIIIGALRDFNNSVDKASKAATAVADSMQEENDVESTDVGYNKLNKANEQAKNSLSNLYYVVSRLA